MNIARMEPRLTAIGPAMIHVHAFDRDLSIPRHGSVVLEIQPLLGMCEVCFQQPTCSHAVVIHVRGQGLDSYLCCSQECANAAAARAAVEGLSE